MCTDSSFAEPWDANNQDDIDAVNTRVAFSYAYYNDPLNFGKYPDEMINLITGNRLPSFTEAESALVKGSFDFLGLNHYTSKFVRHTGIEGRDYSNDGRYAETTTNKYGEYIGLQAQSTWL
jgi:beta-glucosidase